MFELATPECMDSLHVATPQNRHSNVMDTPQLEVVLPSDPPQPYQMPKFDIRCDVKYFIGISKKDSFIKLYLKL